MRRDDLERSGDEEADREALDEGTLLFEQSTHAGALRAGHLLEVVVANDDPAVTTRA